MTGWVLRWALAWAPSPEASEAAPPPPPPPPVVEARPELDERADQPYADASPSDSPPAPTDRVLPPATAAAPAPAPAAAPAPAPEPKPAPPRHFARSKWLTIEGYLQPQYTFRYRQNARPRDQREFGAGDTRAGIIFRGEPLARWTYDIHIVISSKVVEAISDVDLSDKDADGDFDAAQYRVEEVTGLFIERLAIGYRPVQYVKNDRRLVTVDLELGQLRIPFTAQSRSANSALMFPRRSAPNEVFLSGTDLGGQASLGLVDERIELSAGVFNGTGVAIGQSNERGALYAGRLDINPLGGFPYSEGDLDRGPFRFGVGTGVLYFPSRLYDNDGNETRSRARDLRASASLRMSVRGFFVQAEFLRRQRTDSLSERPLLATGAYAQASFFVPLAARVGIAPIGRFGWTRLDESFDPRTSYFAEGGLALYLGNEERPDTLRILGQYLGEWRVTETEQAHGAALQIQLRF